MQRLISFKLSDSSPIAASAAWDKLAARTVANAPLTKLSSGQFADIEVVWFPVTTLEKEPEIVICRDLYPEFRHTDFVSRRAHRYMFLPGSDKSRDTDVLTQTTSESEFWCLAETCARLAAWLYKTGVIQF